MLRKNPRILSVLAALLFSVAATAETYYCKDTAGVSIDQFGVATPDEIAALFEQQQWIVDTNRGWRRTDIPGFSGSCEADNGYVVCRADNIAFGEATLSIHPDGTNFVLVYIDYGLNALSFVGKCSAAETS